MFIDVLKPEEDRTGAVILVWHDGTEGKENPIPFPIVSDPNCVTFGGGDSIFETEYNEEQRQHIVKPESIRLVCPKCGFEHTEDMKHDMNVQGGYIHEIPELLQDAPRLSGGSTSVSTSSIELEGNFNSTT